MVLFFGSVCHPLSESESESESEWVTSLESNRLTLNKQSLSLSLSLRPRFGIVRRAASFSWIQLGWWRDSPLQACERRVRLYLGHVMRPSPWFIRKWPLKQKKKTLLYGNGRSGSHPPLQVRLCKYLRSEHPVLHKAGLESRFSYTTKSKCKMYVGAGIFWKFLHQHILDHGILELGSLAISMRFIGTGIFRWDSRLCMLKNCCDSWKHDQHDLGDAWRHGRAMSWQPGLCL